jgi:hypothetical protein
MTQAGDARAGRSAYAFLRLAAIYSDDWRRIAQTPGLAALILDRVARGDLDVINELLTRHGAGQVWPPEMLRQLERAWLPDFVVTVCNRL